MMTAIADCATCGTPMPAPDHFHEWAHCPTCDPQPCHPCTGHGLMAVTGLTTHYVVPCPYCNGSGVAS